MPLSKWGVGQPIVMGGSVLKGWLWNWKDQKKSVNCDLKARTACQQLWIVVQQRQYVKQSVGARVHRETTHQLWHAGLIPCTNWTRDYPTKKPTVFPWISFDKAYSLCARQTYNWTTDAKKVIKKPHLDVTIYVGTYWIQISFSLMYLLGSH